MSTPVADKLVDDVGRDRRQEREQSEQGLETADVRRALESPGTLDPESVARIQRAAGNAAVGAVLSRQRAPAADTDKIARAPETAAKSSPPGPEQGGRRLFSALRSSIGGALRRGSNGAKPASTRDAKPPATALDAPVIAEPLAGAPVQMSPEHAAQPTDPPSTPPAGAPSSPPAAPSAPQAGDGAASDGAEAPEGGYPVQRAPIELEHEKQDRSQEAAADGGSQAGGQPSGLDGQGAGEDGIGKAAAGGLAGAAGAIAGAVGGVVGGPAAAPIGGVGVAGGALGGAIRGALGGAAGGAPAAGGLETEHRERGNGAAGGAPGGAGAGALEAEHAEGRSGAAAGAAGGAAAGAGAAEGGGAAAAGLEVEHGGEGGGAEAGAGGEGGGAEAGGAEGGGAAGAEGGAPAPPAGEGGAEGGGGGAEAGPGETDEELGRLNAAADAAPSGASPEEAPLGTPAEVAQDAQTEAEGLSQPGPEPESGGGGGGGGAPIEAPPEPPAPDVSNADPKQALATAGALPVKQLVKTLGGVSSAVVKAVGLGKKQLQENPPKMQRPSGSPVTKKGRAHEKAAAPRDLGKHKVTKAHEPNFGPQPQAPKPPPETRSPVEGLQAPPVAGDGQGNVGPNDAAAIQGAVAHLPTQDPNTPVAAGPAPNVNLEAGAAEAQVAQQHGHMEQVTAAAHAGATQEAAQPLGEQEIYPDVPQETLEAEVPAGGGEAAAGAAAGAAVGEAASDEAAAIVAEQEKGGEIRAAVSQGIGQIDQKKREHDEKVAKEHEKAGEEAKQAESESAQQQAEARSKAQQEVQQKRSEWTQEQQQVVEQGKQEAEHKASEASQGIAQERQEAERKAAEHHAEGERQAREARAKGAQEAEQEKQKGEQKASGGFFGWVASAAKSVFDGVKSAIKGVLDFYKSLAQKAIALAQELANKVIDTARKAVIGLVKKAGDFIVAIGDRVLAAFPTLRDKFRNAIQGLVRAAEDAVNRLADQLKKRVKTLLDNLGKAINFMIDLYGKALNFVVDQVKSAVEGAISFAKSMVQLVGEFAALIKDIAANPVLWLKNLGASIIDGIKNHLWVALKTAVKNWFNDKVEELTGFGKAIWDLLKKGGMGLLQVGKMLWEGLKAAIPGILIALLIEKLVSMLVPAAGAILLIIQSIQAAWGTIKRILAAMEKFFAFLKAVKTGKAGPQFAEAVASGAVAAIEFIANFLLRKLKGPASKVGGKLREIAKRIGQRLAAAAKKVFGAVKKGAKSAFGAIKKGAKAVIGGIKKGAKAVGGGIKRGMAAVGRGMGKVGKAIGRGLKRVGKAIGRAAGRARDALKRQYEKLKARYKKWREKHKPDVLTKVKRALTVAFLIPIKTPGMVRGILRFVFNRYRKDGLKGLHVVAGPDNKPGQFDVHAVMSPGKKVKTYTTNLPLKVRDLDLAEPSTALVGIMNGTTPLGRHRSGGKKDPVTKKGPHAEAKLLKFLQAAWGMLSPRPAPQENRILVSITRTPCEDCANLFLNFEQKKKEEGFNVKFDIVAMSLYRGVRATAAQFEIMKLLRSRGHILSVWNVLEDLKAVLGDDYDPAQVPDDMRKTLEYRILQLKKKLEEMTTVSAGSTG